MAIRIAQVYPHADIPVPRLRLRSRRRPFRLSPFYYAHYAREVPVVATRASALPEVVVDGETGILVERGDTDGLGAAICRLLSDPHLRQRMGNAGRERVKRLFTWERSVARPQELYDGILRDTATAPAADAQHVAQDA